MWLVGDVSGSEALTPSDHLYESHINELREASDEKLVVAGDISGTPSIPRVKPRQQITIGDSNTHSDFTTTGTADQTTIQTAIAALDATDFNTSFLGGASTGSLFFREAPYFITGKTTVNKNKFSIKGENTHGPQMRLTNAVFLEYKKLYGRIEDLYILGANIGVGSTQSRYAKNTIDYTKLISHANNDNYRDEAIGNTGIRLNASNKAELQKLWFNNMDVAVDIINGYENDLTGLHVLSSKYGIVSRIAESLDPVYYYVKDFHYEDGAVAGEAAIYGESFAGWIVDSEIVGLNNLNYGLYIRDTYGGFSTIDNLHVESKTGVKLALFSTDPIIGRSNRIEGLSIANSYIQSSTGSAIEIVGDASNTSKVQKISIIGGKRLSSGGGTAVTTGDIITISNAQHITIALTDFYGFNAATNSASLSSIKLVNCHNVKIIGNDFGVQSGINKGAYCIDFDADCTNLTICGNDFTNGYTVAPINFGRTGNDIKVYGNQNPEFESLSNPPANASATGIPGQIEWSNGYIYVCVAANTWKRIAIGTW